MSESGIGKTPEVNYCPHKGIKALDITTAGSYQHPEEAWAIADKVNTSRNLSGEDRMQVEVYSTITRPVLTQLRRLAQLAHIPVAKDLPVSPYVTAEKIWEWKKQYPTVEVVRVHPAFSYNVYELWHRMIIGERENGLNYQMFQAAWIMDFGAATNMKGVELAENLRSQGSDTTMNMHTNVIEGFARDGRLSDVRKRVGSILAENERDYKDPYMKDRAIIYDPLEIVKGIVEKRQEVDGLLLGTDHGYQHGIDMAAILSDPGIRKHTQAIHLANTHTVEHDSIQIGDPKFAHFLSTAGNTWFLHPVRAALDYNPMQFGRLSFDEKVELVGKTRDWVMQMQGSNIYTDPSSMRLSRNQKIHPKPQFATA